MKSIYFLPYTGVSKFDEINNRLKEKLGKIITVESIKIEKEIPIVSKILNFDSIDVIFVPTVFDPRNAASYQGVAFAIRIYLQLVISNERLITKIILLGNEDKSAFFENCNESNFLKCPNVGYLQNSLEAIEAYLLKLQPKAFEKKEAINKLKSVGIKPPTSYKTHHSIANEWSILRWAQAMQLDTKEIEELSNIEKGIENLLYYQYLKTIYPEKKVANTSINLKNSGKILLIDDELEKGWNVIFKNICKNQDYESIGNEFKGMNQAEIVNEAYNKAIQADVVILDLRLHDDDFVESVAIENITGYQILKKIKAHNKGIQVIIFSATNKIWNLQALQKAEADGFIIKESPENSQDPDFTKNSIENMIKTIDGCLEMKFLKEVYKETFIINNINLQIENERNNKLKELKKEIKSSLQTAVYLSRSKHTLDFALLNYIKILEQYCNFFTEFNKTTQKAIVYKNKKDKLDRINEFEIYRIVEVVENNLAKKIIKSNYTFEKGFYDFQRSQKHNEMQFINYKAEIGQYDENPKFFSLSLKLVAVLDVQLGDISKTKDLMELIYIRNNKLAHEGNLDDKKRMVTIYDIELIFSILSKLMKKCL
jgi:DNA-binding NarL/FixJ family response regulator